MSSRPRRKKIRINLRNDENQPSEQQQQASTNKEDSSPKPSSSTSRDDLLSPSGNVQSGSKSPEQTCSICLGKMENKSFTDSCFHTFCYVCLLEWAKVKAVCPLCKQSFKSIIHNVRSNEDYDQYYLKPDENGSADSPDGARFRYRTTLTTERWMDRQQREQQRQLQLLQRPSQLTARGQYRRLRQAATSAFRKRVYANGLRVVRLESEAGRPRRYREVSPEFYRKNPACLHRLVPWLNRELNVLLHGHEDHVQFVLELILDMLQRFHIQSEEFYQHIQSFVGRRIEHFIHEFHSFARSPYDMAAYDRAAVYDESNVPIETVPSSSNSSHDGNDSDIIVLTPNEGSSTATQTTSVNPPPPPQRVDPSEWDMTPLLDRVRSFLDAVSHNTTGTHNSGWDSPTPGPSNILALSPPRPTSPGPTHLPERPPDHSYTQNVKSENDKAKEKNDSSASNSDGSPSTPGSDVVFLKYEKPWEERTPIELSSGEESIVVEEAGPSCLRTAHTHTSSKRKGRQPRQYLSPNRNRSRSRSSSDSLGSSTRQCHISRSSSRSASRKRRLHRDNRESRSMTRSRHRRNKRQKYSSSSASPVKTSRSAVRSVTRKSLDHRKDKRKDKDRGRSQSSDKIYSVSSSLGTHSTASSNVPKIKLRFSNVRSRDRNSRSVRQRSWSRSPLKSRSRSRSRTRTSTSHSRSGRSKTVTTSHYSMHVWRRSRSSSIEVVAEKSASSSSKHKKHKHKKHKKHNKKKKRANTHGDYTDEIEVLEVKAGNDKKADKTTCKKHHTGHKSSSKKNKGKSTLNSGEQQPEVSAAGASTVTQRQSVCDILDRSRYDTMPGFVPSHSTALPMSPSYLPTISLSGFHWSSPPGLLSPNQSAGTIPSYTYASPVDRINTLLRNQNLLYPQPRNLQLSTIQPQGFLHHMNSPGATATLGPDRLRGLSDQQQPGVRIQSWLDNIQTALPSAQSTLHSALSPPYLTLANLSQTGSMRDATIGTQPQRHRTISLSTSEQSCTEVPINLSKSSKPEMATREHGSNDAQMFFSEKSKTQNTEKDERENAASDVQVMSFVSSEEGNNTGSVSVEEQSPSKGGQNLSTSAQAGTAENGAETELGHFPLDFPVPQKEPNAILLSPIDAEDESSSDTIPAETNSLRNENKSIAETHAHDTSSSEFQPEKNVASRVQGYPPANWGSNEMERSGSSSDENIDVIGLDGSPCVSSVSLNERKLSSKRQMEHNADSQAEGSQYTCVFSPIADSKHAMLTADSVDVTPGESQRLSMETVEREALQPTVHDGGRSANLSCLSKIDQTNNDSSSFMNVTAVHQTEAFRDQHVNSHKSDKEDCSSVGFSDAKTETEETDASHFENVEQSHIVTSSGRTIFSDISDNEAEPSDSPGNQDTSSSTDESGSSEKTDVDLAQLEKQLREKIVSRFEAKQNSPM